MKRFHSLTFLFFVIHVSYGQIDPKRIEIIRDEWGVPHIYAPKDAEVAYGLAWAHAEDDFETIQLPLISAKQMLGRHLGKEGAAVDYVVALMRLDQVADEYAKKIDPSFKEVVDGYVQAMNDFAEKYPNRVLVKQAFPIEPIDAYKAYGLSLAVISGADVVIKNLFEGNVAIDHLKEGMGSNAIAVSRAKTTDEYAYLAVNSHQPLEGPVAWYEAHVCSEEGWNMLGGLFPGAPVILHGTNEYLGWAHTINYPDKIDVYQLSIDTNNPYMYQVDGQWKRLESHKQKLTVKIPLGLKLSVKREVLHSDFGPVIRNEKGTFAFNLSVLEDIGALEQWYFMNKANDFEAFKGVLEKVSNPGFNIVYADKEDNIYHVGYAKIPKRGLGYDWKKILPGNSSKLIPNEYHPFSDLPSNENPKSGFVFNMNNSAFSSSSNGHNPDSEDYDVTMGYDVWENNRSTRFLSLMSDKATLSYDDFKQIKYDQTLPDSLVYPVDINPLFKENYETSSSKASQVQSLISSWDKQASLEAIGPALAIKVYEFLQERLDVPYKDYFKPSRLEFDLALEKTYDYFMKYFGRLDVKLGEFQYLVRGEKELPVSGVDDVIASIRSAPYEEGKIKAIQGESYIMMIRYPEEGLPIVETINVYGASNQPDSPHYDDQMELFVNKRLKSMSLDIDAVREKAKQVYHPE